MWRDIETLLPWQSRLLDQIEKALEEIRAGGNSVGILFSGPSGTGKTTIGDGVVARHPEYRAGVQRCVPCCRVSAGSKSDMTSVARSILRQLNKPQEKLRGNELEAQVHEALIACRVLILLLEEVGNALLTGAPHLRGQLELFLKNLWNGYPSGDSASWAQPNLKRGDHRMVIIVSGTEKIRSVFGRDPELKSRFSCRVNTESLGFNSPEHRVLFRKIFGTLARRWGLSQHIDLNDPGILARSLFACGGHLRELETLLQRTATLHRKSAGTAMQELMAPAYDEVLGRDFAASNPFRWSETELKERIAAATSQRRKP